MAKAKKSAKGKGVKKAAKKKVTKRPDKRLGFFLIELAIDNSRRDAFDKDPEATLNGLKDPLGKEARAAVLAQDGATLADRLQLNNQTHFPAIQKRK